MASSSVYNSDTLSSSLNDELKVNNEISEWLENVGCNFDEYLDNIKVVENKGSVSDSVIMFGEINKINKGLKKSVAFKINFGTFDKFDNSLIVEQQIYINIIENLINNLHTPHLTPFIGFVKSCNTDKLLEKLNPDERVKFQNAMKIIKKDNYIMNNVSLLILGKSEGKTLFDYMNSNILSISEKFSIIFQILYTLRCCEKIGLSHNDLHSNNIFIDKIIPQERIYYISDDKWVKIVIEYDVKIYDFDRGSVYHPAVDRNFNLDTFCITSDQCNKYNSRRDLSSIVAYFIKLTEPVIHNFFKQVTSQLFIETLIRRKYVQHNAFLTREGLKSGPSITDDQLKSIGVCIDKILNIPEFIHESGSGRTNGIIFTLPPSIKSVLWNPISSISHKSSTHLYVWSSDGSSRKRKIVKISSDSISKFLIDEYITSLNKKMNDYILQDIYHLYENEFGKDYLYSTKDTLFKEFIKLKKVDETFHVLYLISCYILCIPFIYKLNQNDIISFINRYILIEKEGGFLNQYINDIWNVFNSILPIQMLKV